MKRVKVRNSQAKFPHMPYGGENGGLLTSEVRQTITMTLTSKILG